LENKTDMVQLVLKLQSILLLPKYWNEF